LAPGEKIKLSFEFTRANQGFVDRGSDTRLVYNGSYVTNRHLFPRFGYNSNIEISSRNERKERVLPPQTGLPTTGHCAQHLLQLAQKTQRAKYPGTSPAATRAVY
jgi:hypothetical protein